MTATVGSIGRMIPSKGVDICGLRLNLSQHPKQSGWYECSVKLSDTGKNIELSPGRVAG